MTGLWRAQPVAIKGGKTLPPNCIFASGRQALQHGMQRLGLSRVNRVAYPEYSSACVVSCIARVASPIPFTDVMRFGIKVDTVIIYEQWGWPYTNDVIEQVLELCQCQIILDCVDSPDAIKRYGQWLNQPEHHQVQLVISLSKCLGLKAGGLLYAATGWQNSVIAREPAIVYEADPAKCADINKTYSNNVELISPFLDCDIEAMLSAEAQARQDRLLWLANLGVADDWPTWMHAVIEQGKGAPGIAPLYANASDSKRLELQAKLADMGIETAIYNFNFSGHPLKTDYRPCLALPIHSELPMGSALAQLLLSIK
ncbi:hypothetical protein [Motilimonas sp. KMU-193]|uniref:hypothetical protein n=1 Tax=Motilimonas sp. KMU-193 TaxID=3388668 RepID=UPI00396B21A2